jgi:hypothetical protein
LLDAVSSRDAAAAEVVGAHLQLTVDLLVAETTRYADRLARTESLVVSVGTTSPHR